MKKIVALILAISAILCMSVVSTFAADLEGIGESEKFEVAADYVFIPNTGDVYGVNLSWTEVVFTYTVVEGEWDPETLTSDGSATWDAQEKTTTITVENRSNVAITAEASYEAAAVTSYATFKYVQDGDAYVVIDPAYEGDATGTFATIEATIKLSAGATISSDKTVGVITVTIS